MTPYNKSYNKHPFPWPSESLKHITSPNKFKQHGSKHISRKQSLVTGKTLPNGMCPRPLSRDFGEGAERPSDFGSITEATRKRNGSSTEAQIQWPVECQDSMCVVIYRCAFCMYSLCSLYSSLRLGPVEMPGCHPHPVAAFSSVWQRPD